MLGKFVCQRTVGFQRSKKCMFWNTVSITFGIYMHAYFINYVRGLWGGKVMIYMYTGIYQGNPYMKSTYIFIS